MTDDGRVRPAPGPSLVLLLTLSTAAVDPLVGLLTTAPYSFRTQAISDLAVSTCGTLDAAGGARTVCSPWWPLMSVAMVTTGVALVLSGLLLRRRLGAGRAALAALVVAGLGSVGVGLVPLDASVRWHTVLATPVFGALALAALLLARPVGSALGRGWSAAFTAGGVLSALASASILAPDAWQVPFGVVERLGAYLLPLLLAALGVRLLGGDVRQDGLTARRGGSPS